MSTIQRSTARRLAVTSLACCLAISVANPATASPETLQRSLENIILSPVDLALSPVTAGWSIYTGMQDIDDSLGVKIVYPIPGFVWNTMVNVGAAALRMTSGLFELIPGILLLPFEADLDPLFAPVERADALVDYEFEYFWFKFGVLYTSPPSY